MSQKAPVADFIETASGRFFHFDAPEFHIEDIAAHLARLKRYNGACQEYSVAEHCWHVSHLCRNPLEGLMHDAPEAYIGDMSSPLKHRPEMAGFRALDDRLYAALAPQFGLDPAISADTHYWDCAMGFIEADWLMPSGGRHWPRYEAFTHLLGTRDIHCWDAGTARRKFMERFQELQPIAHPHAVTFNEVFNGR